MSAVVIIGSLVIAVFIVWGCCTETPAVARTRDVDEDEAGRGPDEF